MAFYTPEAGRRHKTNTKRHPKIKANANPYLKEYFKYFKYRTKDKEAKCLPAMTSRELHKMKNVKMAGYTNRVTLEW